MKKTTRTTAGRGLPITAVVLAAVMAMGPCRRHWRRRPQGLASSPSSGFSPVSVTYVSASDGWALGTVACGPNRCLRLLRTTDDGATWSPVPVPARRP